MEHSIYDKYLELARDGTFNLIQGRQQGRSVYFEEYIKLIEKEEEMARLQQTRINDGLASVTNAATVSTTTSNLRYEEPMRARVDEYILLQATTHNDLTSQVQGKLNQGFRVHGVTTATVIPLFGTNPDGSWSQTGSYMEYTQAVTRKAYN